MKKILLAGATGYLGGFILKQLLSDEYYVRAVVRNPAKLEAIHNENLEVDKAQITQPDSLIDCCKDMDVVISTVGITRQKDGLTYMDVDYQANLNLLNEAKRSGVKKFVYVSVLNGKKLTHLKICEAKEKFVKELKESGMDYCILRPNGFFSDMEEFYEMALKGRIYLFGDGEYRSNPIHGADLAEICIDAIHNEENEIECGGPQTLSHNQIADIAFSVTGNKKKITHIPNWVRIGVLTLIRFFTSSKIYGPIEFFMTVLSMDMIAPEYGSHTVENYFLSLKGDETQNLQPVTRNTKLVTH